MGTPYKDYYKILGVDHKATETEIKAAFRKAARKYHPDLHIKSDKAAAEEKFKEINEAYTVLGDPEKRSQYDLLGTNLQNGQDWQPSRSTGGYGSRPWSQTGADGAGSWNQTGAGGDRSWSQTDADGFSDFFESLFGRQSAGGNRGEPAHTRTLRGQDLDSELEVTLEEAFHGGKKSLQFSFRSLCPSCRGTGVSDQKLCPKCAGTGSRTVVRTLDVDIPAFIRDGSKIRLKGQGADGSANGTPGDLLLTVKILPNSNFTLNGSDLEMILTIKPEQAVLGCQITVPTVDGEVILTVPHMIHNGKKLRMKSRGWLEKDGSRGDQIVKIMIDIPRTLSPAEKEIYQRLAETGKEVRKS